MASAQTPDASALLAMSEEDIRALPQELAAQVQELISRHQELARAAENDRRQRLTAMGQRILGIYNTRLGQRQQLELRWLEDIRRYNGQYAPEELTALQGREYGSRAFVPLTRRLIDIVEARCCDLLFPTDERGFVVSPSPVTELMHVQALAARLPGDYPLPAGPGGSMVPAGAVRSAIAEIMEKAKRAADNMQRLVDDQLSECNYPATGRRILHDGLVVGTGVIKGPVVECKKDKAFVDGKMQYREKYTPVAKYVSFWNFFPDLSARELRESESEIERHYLARSEMATLQRQPGFETSADEFRRILRVAPGHRQDANLDQLRTASGTQGVPDPRYMVLEFHGPVDRDELIDAGVEVPDDELLVYEGIVWVFEDGTVLKAAIEPLETCERPYSVYCWRKDPGSIFGFGLSYEVADIQETANSSFRAALDNVGLSVGGMVGIDRGSIRPENGRWAIEPNKIWVGTKAGVDMRAAIAFHEIPNNLEQILALFDRSKQILDDIGGPAMAMQGQEAPSYLDTARGASIAYNAANIWFRRAVTYWDDDMTTPLVGRFVDFNMEYSTDDSVKGDWDVESRGRSALLEAEAKAQKLLWFAGVAKEVPLPFETKVSMLREVGVALRIDPDKLLPDEAKTMEISRKMEAAEKPMDPSMARIKISEAELADREKQRQVDLALAQQHTQLRMAEIASREGITREQAQAKYGVDVAKIDAMITDRREQRAHDAQALNAELAMKAAKGSGI